MFKRFFLLLLTIPLAAAPFQAVQEAFPGDAVLKGATDDQDVMLCLHGFGMDDSIGSFVHDTQMAPHHFVSFNFPDFGERINILEPETLAFGSVREMQPIVERLHRCITDLKAERIHLYGFSAGGGAAANVLGVLKDHRFTEELKLTEQEMDAIYAALERGTVVLDCPLKSLDEICEEREPGNPYLERMAAVFRENDMRPIDALNRLHGSKLSIVLLFQQPDDVLSNRDDQLFIERLEAANHEGVTIVVQGSEGIHLPAMPSLVEAYRPFYDFSCFSIP